MDGNERVVSRPPVRRQVLLRGGPQASRSKTTWSGLERGGVPGDRWAPCRSQDGPRSWLWPSTSPPMRGFPQPTSPTPSARRYLAKADLVTNAVVEFTSVQGVMGSLLRGGLRARRDQVAQRHRRPLPPPLLRATSLPAVRRGAQVVAMADKLDTICGLFAVGQGPTGSSDPFALRRSGHRHRSPCSRPGCRACRCVPAIDAALGSAMLDAGIAFDQAVRARRRWWTSS